MRIAKRLDAIPPYLFVAINQKIAQKKAEGHDVISFAIGDPDLPTPPHLLERLHKLLLVGGRFRRICMDSVVSRHCLHHSRYYFLDRVAFGERPQQLVRRGHWSLKASGEYPSDMGSHVDAGD